MSATKPEIVFIGGAWHFPSHYTKFRDVIESQQGLNIHVPQLPSMNGAQPPTADLYTDTATIRELVTGLVDDGHYVIILMHSYGGNVGTNALVGLGVDARKQKGLPGGVVELVYICAHALQEGQSVFQLMRTYGNGDLIPVMFDIAADGTCLLGDPKSCVGSGLSDTDLESYIGSLGRWNGNAFEQPLEQCAWRDIPVSYIYTAHDAVLPLAYQKAFVGGLEAAGRKVRTFDIETGHCPTMTTPEELANIIQDIISNTGA